MSSERRSTGISVIGDVPWGLHFSVFYHTEADLLDTLVPYFAEGLTAHELCVWAPSEPSVERLALEALRARVPNLDRLVADGSFVSFRYEDFFKPDGHLDIDAARAQWHRWERRASGEGFAGLRGGGNLTWVKDDNWALCHEYEEALRRFVVGRRAMVLCCYPLASLSAGQLFTSARTHSFLIARRDGAWETLEIPALARTKDELQRQNDQLEERVRERSAQLTAANADLRREVEERRRVDEALRRSEAYLRHGQRLTHTGSFAGTLRPWRAVFWSEETYRIFGLEPRTHPPDRDEILDRIHPSDRARVEATVDGFLEREGGNQLDYRIVRPDGSTRYVHAVTFPLLDETGRRCEYVGTVVDVTEQKQAAARLARVKRDARERTLQARFAAVLEERQRVARDIHDTILQGVTGIALQLRATLPNLGTAPPATVATIGRIVELADATVRDARRAIWQMRDPLLTRDGLPAALADEVRRRADGVEVRFAIDGVPRRLPLDVEDAILRVGREAAVNAVRHSGARSVSVRLSYEPRQVRLTVEDAGRGFRTDAGGRSHGGHWGILGMHESAERIGATLSVRSAEGAGTTVELLVSTVRTRKNRPAIRPARASAARHAASSIEPEIPADADSRSGR